MISALDHALAAARRCEVQPDVIVGMLDNLARSFPLIAAARTRAVFDRGDGFVIKVATTEEGMIANAHEANWSEPFIPLAPCHLEWLPDAHSVLVMEKVVRFPTDYRTLPDWTGWVDGAQVGYLKDDRLVAYDL